MKLLRCLACQSELIPLSTETSSCPCGASQARYVTMRKVHVTGPAEIWGVSSLRFFSGDGWHEEAQPLPDSPWICHVEALD